MPEGVEVHVLARALVRAGIPCLAHGKHIYARGHDYSFGLVGRLRLERDATGALAIHKVVSPRVPSGAVEPEGPPRAAGAGNVDWATASAEELAAATATWGSRARCLGALLLDQSLVAGIGVAWGSEILHAAGALNPVLPANAQDLRRLVPSMCAVRDAAVERYAAALEAATDPVEFVNDWFHNLYAVRGDLLAVYKSGTVVMAAGRAWWV
jgi:hypothetical protein